MDASTITTKPETFQVAVPVPENDSVLLCVQAKQCITLALAQLSILEPDFRMVDPAVDDPYPMVQSVLRPKGADSVQIISFLTLPSTRLYSNTEPNPLLFQKGDIVAAVRVERIPKR